MLHLPFLRYQASDDVILGRLRRFPVSLLFRVTVSASTTRLHIISILGKGKSKLLEYCLILERIKASVTVLEFVSQYVDLKPTASGAVGLCPGNYWDCFAGCGGDR